MKKIKNKINELIENGTNYIFVIFSIINIIMFLNRYILKIEIIDNIYNVYLDYIIKNILSKNNRDFLINILSILSGFVITIISVFGIGYSKATIKICEDRLEEKFCKIAKEIVYTSIILLAMILLMYNIREFEIFTIIMFLLIVYIIIRFMIFGVVVFKMFDYNIKNSKIEFEEDNRQNKEIIMLLRKIANIESENIGDYEKSKKYNEEMRTKG